jgi:hypothetical protein
LEAQSILQQLETAYGAVCKELEKYGGYLTANKRRTGADCLLFDHLVTMLSTPKLEPVVKKYEALLKFFHCIRREYFVVAKAAPRAARAWKVISMSIRCFVAMLTVSGCECYCQDAMVITASNKFLTAPLFEYKELTDQLLAELLPAESDTAEHAEGFGDEEGLQSTAAPTTWVQRFGIDVSLVSRIANGSLLSSVNNSGSNAEIATAEPEVAIIGLGGCVFGALVLGSFAAYSYHWLAKR